MSLKSIANNNLSYQWTLAGVAATLVPPAVKIACSSVFAPYLVPVVKEITFNGILTDSSGNTMPVSGSLTGSTQKVFVEENVSPLRESDYIEILGTATRPDTSTFPATAKLEITLAGQDKATAE